MWGWSVWDPWGLWLGRVAGGLEGQQCFSVRRTQFIERAGSCRRKGGGARFPRVGADVCEGWGRRRTHCQVLGGAVCRKMSPRSDPSLAWQGEGGQVALPVEGGPPRTSPASSPAQPVSPPSFLSQTMLHLSPRTAQAKGPVTNFPSHLSHGIFSYLKHFLINCLSTVDEVNISFDQ